MLMYTIVVRECSALGGDVETVPAWVVEKLLDLQKNEGSESDWQVVVKYLEPHVFFIALHEQRRKWPSNPNPSIAEDMMQEAFLSLFTNLHRLTDFSTLFGWFRIVIQRKLIDLNRRHYTQQEITTDSFNSDQLVAGSHSEQCETSLDIAAIIGGLDEKFKEMLYYRYWLGYSVPEAAEKLDIPLGTAKSRLWLAHKYIAKVIKLQNAR